jgi:anaerobic magnesium-protoporphyrin IX monomethyl ester cyclase
MLYVTPHRWMPFFRLAGQRRVIQTDRRRWDYKHQVLATRHMPPWCVLLWVKFMEAALQCRPKALYRTFIQPDRRLRHAMRWYSQMGRRVWPFELRNFFFRDRRLGNGPTVAELWGAPQDAEEQSMAAAHPERQVALRKAA